jgi:hypothetical protein
MRECLEYIKDSDDLFDGPPVSPDPPLGHRISEKKKKNLSVVVDMLSLNFFKNAFTSGFQTKCIKNVCQVYRIQTQLSLLCNLSK